MNTANETEQRATEQESRLVTAALLAVSELDTLCGELLDLAAAQDARGDTTAAAQLREVLALSVDRFRAAVDAHAEQL